MSTILDTLASMSHEERLTWGSLAVGLAVFVAYVRTLAERAAATPLVDVAYVGPMIWSIVVGIVGTILVGIVVGAIWSKEAGASDQRDREIGRFGENVGRGFLVAGALTAMVLAMVQADHFWIANALFASFFLASFLEGVTKLVAYRRGYHPW